MRDSDYRSHVGDPKEFDRRGAVQFCVMTMVGLREHHYLLDLGCGSLRGGRLFIPYLLAGHYFGIDSEWWPVRQGVINELGEEILRVKRPFLTQGDVGGEDFVSGLQLMRFDYVLAQAVFCHMTVEQVRRCMGHARRVMKGDALFVASFHEGKQDDPRTELTYPEVAWYRMATMRKAAADAGLKCSRLNRTLLGGTDLDRQYARMSWIVMERES